MQTNEQFIYDRPIAVLREPGVVNTDLVFFSSNFSRIERYLIPEENGIRVVDRAVMPSEQGGHCLYQNCLGRWI